MKSVDPSLLRGIALAVWCMAIAGCSSVSLDQPAAPPAVPAPAVAAAPAPAAAATREPRPPVVAPPVPPPVRPTPPDDVAAVSPNVQRAYDEARRALRANRLDDAERSFKALARSNPELGGPHANLGVIYRQSGKLAESAAALEQAVKASPQQPVYYNQLGITYRHQGQFTKARDVYARAIELDPQYAGAMLNLGVLHDLYLWDAPRALELYERYLVLTPGGDAAVTKWVADLKNRKPTSASAAAPARKEKE